MNTRQHARKERINEIIEFIQSQESNGEVIVKRDMILALMARYNLTQRTATEYYNQAKFENDHR